MTARASLGTPLSNLRSTPPFFRPRWAAGVLLGVSFLMILAGGFGHFAPPTSPALPSGGAHLAAVSPQHPSGKALSSGWVQVCSSCGPSIRADGPMVYDAADAYTLYFGGFYGSTYYNDTWTYQGGVWTQLAITHAPTPRAGARMVYDPTDGYVVLFGGHNPGGVGLMNDTWTYKAGVWTQLVTPHAPSPRYDTPMTWDASDGYLLLFAGCANAPCSIGASDTWSFLSGTWTQLTPTLSPPEEEWPGMAYDAADGYVVLQGGDTASYQAQQAAYTFHAGQWAPLYSASHPPANQPVMVWDAAKGNVVLFGGGDNGTGNNQTWTYVGGQWTLLSTPISPQQRGDEGMDYDASVGAVLLFAGQNDVSAYLNDLWQFNGASASPLTISSFTAAPTSFSVGSSTTLTVSASGGAPPLTYAYSGLPAGCSSADVSTLTCTPTGAGASTVTVWVNDTAAHSVTAATSFTATVLPLSITSFTATPSSFAVGSSTTLQVQATGGTGALSYAYTGLPAGCASADLSSLGCTPSTTGTSSVEAWVNDSSGGRATATTAFQAYAPEFGNWTNICSACGPSPRADGALVYDAADGYTLYFGGFDYPSPYYNDTWKFVGGVWSQIATPYAPSPRAGAKMVYDPTDGYVVLFGGHNPGGVGLMNDTWTYRGGVWTQLSTPHAPSPRYDAPMTWDASDGYLLLYGGCSDAPCNSGTSDTWSFLHGAWTQLAPLQSPQGEEWPGMAYDATDGYVVLQGGDSFSYQAQQSTWTFHAGQWTPLYTLTHPGANQPVMVWDAAKGFVLSYGGGDNGTSDTQTWTFVGGQWHLITTAVFPSARGDEGYAYDPTMPGVLMVGGEDSTNTFLNDTWVYGTYSAPPALTVSLAATPNPAVLGQQVAFTSTVSGGVAPYTYSWNFGDGGVGGNLANITHVFETDGPFVTVLTVVDARGVVGHADVSISISLNVTVSANATLGAAPLPVGFASSVRGGVPGYTYAWNFGDGTSSSVANPTHVFSGTGTFHTLLTVTDSQSHTATATWAVAISSGGGPLVASLAAIPSTIHLGNSSNLVAAISGGHGAYAIAWSDVPSWCTLQTANSLECLPTVAGTFTIKVAVTDGSGTTVVSSATLVVLGKGGPAVPPPTFLGLTYVVAYALFSVLVAVVIGVVALLAVASRRRKSLGRGGSGGAGPNGSPAAPPPDPHANEPVPMSGPGDPLGDAY